MAFNNPIDLSVFKKLLPRKSSKYRAAVEIIESGVKWMYAEEEQGRWVIKRVRFQKLNPESDEEIISFLASCYGELGLSDRKAYCLLPSKQFITKSVDMPSNDPEEIKKIVTLHAGRYTPYSREEIVIDYLSLQVPGQHYTNVLLLIVNRVLAERYLRIFTLAGVELERMISPAESIADLYVHWTLGETGNEALGGIYMDHETSDVIVAEHRQLAFVRNIPIGYRHFEDDYKENVQKFMNEIKESLHNYQDQGIGRPIAHLIFSGMTDRVGELESDVRSLIRTFGEMSKVRLRFVPYTERFMFQESALQAMEAEKEFCGFDVASTLIVGDRIKVNLIPDEVKLQRQVREGGKDVINIGIIVMTALLLISLFLATKIYLKNYKIDRIESKYVQTSDEARLLENASTKTRVLQNFLEKRGKGLYVFDRLRSMIGDDIYLAQFTYDEEANITLSGTANSMSRVYAFVTKLEESLYFQNVEAAETKTRKQQGKEVADFVINCKFAEMGK